MRRRMMMGQNGGGGDDNPYAREYLTVTAVGRTRVRVSFTGGGSSTWSYSTDNGSTWTSANSGSYTPYLEIGESVLIKANGFLADSSGSVNITGDALFDISGNIMSLLYGDNFLGKTTLLSSYQFAAMFLGNSNVRDASNLVLPATTLTDYCYYSMFFYCANLTGVPALPAATLTEGCYSQMFQLSSNVNRIECLATDISATNCLRNWVSGVAASGTFVKAPTMTSWPSGANGIPSGWTVQDAT